MSVRMILLPVFVHVALVFFLLFSHARSRPEAAERGANQLREIELGALFYVLTICAWQTKFADLLYLILAWIFVGLRILESFGGAISGASPGWVFVVSAAVLAAMWAIYALRLLLLLG